MHLRRFLGWGLLVAFGLAAFPVPPAVVRAADAGSSLASPVSAGDLIVAMNTLRVSHGLPALIEDPIVDAVAQQTAATMAAEHLSWHIGNVSGRLAAAGYGQGGTVWATENFAVGGAGMGIDQIMAIWSDPDHMRPAVDAAYCNVGAGVAQASGGEVYYVFQAAWVSGQACGSSSPATGGGSQPVTSRWPVVQPVTPVKIATPDAEGKIYHVVQPGQALWSIAVAYQVTVHDLEVWNNLSGASLLSVGQRLLIPVQGMQGVPTPTPLGLVVLQPPDATGKIVHEVQPYQTLSAIAAAYHVSVGQILALNGIQEQWPLHIGQKLLISPSNITPSPTLSAIQRLTPDVNGQYYHTVQSGETLSGIARLFGVPLSDLMRRNGLDGTSILRPGEKLLLPLTPPVTPTLPATPTPLAPSATALAPSPSPSDTGPEPTETTPVTASAAEPVSTPVTPPVATRDESRPLGPALYLGLGAIALAGLLAGWKIIRRT